MILKPDQGGTAGRHITVKTNIFPVSIVGEVVFHHYDVKLDPVVPMDLSHKAFNQFQAVAKKKTPTFWAVYDGKGSAFSTSLYEVNSLDVYIEQETEMVLPPIRSQSPTVSGRGRGGGRGGRGGRGGSSAGGFSSFSHESINWKATSINKASSKYMKVTITVKKVQTVELDKLLQHTCGKIEEDSEVSTAMMTLSVYLRYLPSLLYVAVGTNFFVPDGRIPISGSGLEIWRGTHQSFKSLLSGHLGINVDLASAVFLKGGISLIDYILEANGLRSPKEIANLSRNALLKTLNGVSVITAHRGDQKQRFRIKSISAENASELTFERENQQITVAEYFLTQYNIKLMYPNLPLAQKANGKTAFPIECLRVVAGERFKERLSGTQTAEMIKATVQKPSDRMKVITDTVTKALKFDSNPFLKSAGIKIDSTMMSVKARILPTPDVKFRGKKQPASEGKWELRNQKVI
jgi:eukaryotic translation initiation factor 2C